MYTGYQRIQIILIMNMKYSRIYCILTLTLNLTLDVRNIILLASRHYKLDKI